MDLSAYNVGLLQNFLHLIDRLPPDTTMTGLRNMVTGRLQMVQVECAVPAAASRTPGQAAKNGRLVPCPLCGTPVALYRVNVSRCTAVGGGWRSQALCRHCGFERYTTESVAQIVRRGKL